MTLGSWLWSISLAIRLLISMPLGIVIFVAVVLLIAVFMAQMLWLLPLALLFGILVPGETDARVAPIALPSMHVVVLGGGHGLTRAVERSSVCGAAPT